MSDLLGGASRPLFVSDLDGTLLRPDGSLGDRTVQVVNALVAAGGLFTYATARSFTSASGPTAALDLRLPLITYGGAVLADPRSGDFLSVATLPADVVRTVQEVTAGSPQVQPVVFAVHAGRDRLCWLADQVTPHLGSFLERRRGDPRLLPLDTWADIPADTVFYICLIGGHEQVAAIAGQLGEELHRCHSVLAEDVYTPGEYWLEITSREGSKATALAALRERTGADLVVCFGDNLNDLCMFEAADAAFAVADAAPALRRSATGVIDTNAAEGVAAWLSRHAMP